MQSLTPRALSTCQSQNHSTPKRTIVAGRTGSNPQGSASPLIQVKGKMGPLAYTASSHTAASLMALGSLEQCQQPPSPRQLRARMKDLPSLSLPTPSKLFEWHGCIDISVPSCKLHCILISLCGTKNNIRKEGLPTTETQLMGLSKLWQTSVSPGFQMQSP